MDQQSGQGSYQHYEGGFRRGRGNRNQRGGGRGRGFDRSFRGNDRRDNRQFNRDHGREDNRQYNKDHIDERPQRGGFGRPTNYQGPNVQKQEDMTEKQNHTNFNDRARPKEKNNEDRLRSSSPDRLDRSRPKEKNWEDHARDPSPDRSHPEHCIQKTLSPSFDGLENATTQEQSQQAQQGQSAVASGFQEPNLDQQSYANQNTRWDGQQGEGHNFYNQGQQGQDYRHQQNNRWYGRGQQQQEYYGKWDGYYQNQERGQQYWGYDNRKDGYHKGQGRSHQPQGYNDSRDGYQQGHGRGRQQTDERRQQRSWGEKSDIQLSKALSFILRHGAERQGYKMMPGGFLYVEEILKKQQNLRDYDIDDVRRIVETNDKKRFYMELDKETGKLKIRANQGHTIEVEDLDLKPLVSKDEAPEVIHGTYWNSWEKIKHTGLSRMGRNHIHFAAGEPGESGVISGMRKSCEVMIYINLEKALEDGFKFFLSANNVILCAGNEDGVIPPSYFKDVVQRYPRQRLEFDKSIAVSKVPIGGEGFAQEGKGKKKKKKKNKGDREKEEGTETQKKKEKTEIDDTAIEDTAELFNEKMDVDEASGQGGLDKIKEAYSNTPPPDSWDEDDKFEDAVQEQETEEEFADAEVAPDGSDVKVECYEEIITIDETDNSISAVEYLQHKDVVAVHCETSEDGFRRITCVAKDKAYIFELEKNPDLMTAGKVAEFFNYNLEPVKVFHGLDSKTTAMLFEKYEIILDGTKIFDLKVAYDMMEDGGFGNITKLRETGFNPDFVTIDNYNVNAVCLTYLKGYQYFTQQVHREMKDYKKQLFQKINADIAKEDLKKLKERKKKQSKAANQTQSSGQGHTSKPKKGKKKGC